MPTYEGYTVGIGKTYTTITACETAKNANQLTADKQIDALLASEAFDEAVTVQGGTNDATRYFRIRADDACEFDIATRTGARIVSSGITAGRTAVTLRDAYARLGGSSGNSTGAIGIKLSGTGTTALQGVETRGTGASVLVSQICCYDFSSSGSSLTGFYNETAGTDFTTVNCSAINSVTTGSAKDADGFWRTASGVITAYNCVALHMTGTDDAYGFFGCTVYNCYAGGMTGGGGAGNEQLAFNGSVGGDYNAADDSTTSGFTHNLQSKAAANQFVNAVAGSEDLHLKAGADLIDAGYDYGYGNDIGAFQYVAGGNNYEDAGEAIGAGTVTPADLFAGVDAATTTSPASVSAADLLSALDAVGVTGAAAISAADLLAALDAAETSGAGTVSAADLLAAIDAQTTQGTGAASSEDLLAAVEASSVSAAGLASLADLFAGIDAGNVSAEVTAIVVEALAGLDVGTVSAASLASLAELLAAIDAGSVSAEGSATVAESVPGIDEGTATADGSVTVSEILFSLDSGTVTAATSALIAALLAGLEAGEALAETMAAGADIYTPYSPAGGLKAFVVRGAYSRGALGLIQASNQDN